MNNSTQQPHRDRIRSRRRSSSLPAIALAMIAFSPASTAKSGGDSELEKIKERVIDRHVAHLAFLEWGNMCGTGTGIIHDHTLYICTLHTCCPSEKGAEVVTYLVSGGRRRYTAEYRGAAEDTGVGVMELPRSQLRPKSKDGFAVSSTPVREGEVVLSVGNLSETTRNLAHFGVVTNTKFEDRTTGGRRYIEHKSEMRSPEFGGALLRVLLDGGEFVVKDGTISVKRTGRSRPKVKSVEFLGLNMKSNAKEDDEMRVYCLPASVVLDGVKQLVDPEKKKPDGEDEAG